MFVTASIDMDCRCISIALLHSCCLDSQPTVTNTCVGKYVGTLARWYIDGAFLYSEYASLAQEGSYRYVCSVEPVFAA